MAKVFAPNKDYTGISANVVFKDGVGETSDPHLIEWFKSKGYTVDGAEGAPKPPAKQKPAQAKDPVEKVVELPGPVSEAISELLAHGGIADQSAAEEPKKNQGNKPKNKQK